MQTMLQLNPPIPLVTPKGEGLAVMVIDYGPDHDLWWTVIVHSGPHSGEIWTYPNPQVRGVENITLGRRSVTAAAEAPELAEAGRFTAGGRWGVTRSEKGPPEISPPPVKTGGAT